MEMKLFKMLTTIFFILVILSACDAPAPKSPEEIKPTGGFVPSGEIDRTIKATLTMAVWDTNATALYNKFDLEERFQKHYPNVSIEVEQSKDDSEYWESMEIRATANQLPDIMFNKPFSISRFKEYLYPLNTVLTDEIDNNILAESYSVDGDILGLPEKNVGDYVYFWEDMFEGANIEIPATWGEFIKAAEKLQRFYEQENSDFAAIAIGARDAWSSYPFTEFMPALISGNGNYWNDMASQDTPFAPDTDIYRTYQRVAELFQSGICGKNPLGIGYDQSVAQFAQRKSAIIVAGSWFLSDIMDATEDIEGLSSFYLPVRMQTSETFYYITQGDNLMGVTKHSNHPDLAMEFMRFYFSEDWYRDYVDSIPDDSAMDNFPKTKDVVLEMADISQPDATMLIYGRTDEAFILIQDAAKFDYKQLGSKMFMPGFDLDAELKDLNIRWASARRELSFS